MADAAEIARLQAILDADPVMRSLRATSAGAMFDMPRHQALGERLQALGVTLPECYDLGVRGNIKKKGSKIATLAKIGGVTRGGTRGGSAVDGGAGAGAGTGGVGIGETAAKIGLGGSGGPDANWWTDPDWWMKVLGTATTLYGSKQASEAANRAAEIQAASAEKAAQLQADVTREALAQQAGQWETAQANQAPWLRAGTASLDRLQGLMGLSGPASGGGGGPVRSAPGTIPQSMVPGYGAATSTVMMRAPNGATQAVPIGQVTHYQQRGAQVVG